MLPGSTIRRVYKGEALEVNVLPAGFEYEGETYKSLSAVAKKITGSHCNGYLFFRLTKDGGKPSCRRVRCNAWLGAAFMTPDGCTDANAVFGSGP